MKTIKACIPQEKFQAHFLRELVKVPSPKLIFTEEIDFHRELCSKEKPGMMKYFDYIS